MFLNIIGSEQVEYTGDLQEITGFRIDGINSCYINVDLNLVCMCVHK